MLGLVDPAFERNPENGNSRFGGEDRSRIADAASTQPVRECASKWGELDALALLELSVSRDDGLASPGIIPALPK